MAKYTLADLFKSAGVFVPKGSGVITLTKKPFKHQIEDIKHLTSFIRSGLYNDPGTGKTLSMQAYGIWLVLQGNKVVYTMPPTLVPQFIEKFQELYVGTEKWLTCKALQGQATDREQFLLDALVNGWPEMLAMSYEMFRRYYLVLKKAGYNCVMVDEATAVKKQSSKIHAAVKTFAGNHRKDSNGVVLVTGTPIETHVEDCFGLMHLLDPDMYGSEKTFERVHCNRMPIDGNSRFDKIISYKNLPLLNANLYKYGRRVKKADVLDLPARMISEIKVPLSKSHLSLYQKLVDERIAEIGTRVIDLTEKSAIYQAMQRALMTPGAFTDKKIENSLLAELDTLLLETLEGRKVVVYAWYQSTIDMLKERYKALNPAVLNGKVTDAARTKQKRKFIDDPTCQVIFANFKSGGVGVDGFQDVCSHAVYAEVCPWVGTFTQSIDRLHRSGQKAESVTAYVLVAIGTIAVKLRNDLLTADRQQESAMVDGRKVLQDLMGKDGIQGSLDNINFDNLPKEEENVIDIYQEMA